MKAALAIFALIASLAGEASSAVPQDINAGSMNITGVMPTFLLDGGNIDAGSMNITGVMPSFLLDGGNIDAGSMNITGVMPTFLLDGGNIDAGSMNITGVMPTFLLDGGNIDAGSMNITGVMPTFLLDGGNIDAGSMKITGVDTSGKPLTSATPKTEAPKPAIKTTSPKKSDGRIQSFKLLSQRPISGTNPFSVKDVSKLDQAPKLASPESPTESAPTPPETPTTTPTTPTTPDNSPTPTVVTRRTINTAVTAGFTCAGKPDGQYCKDANTQVFCYKDSEANKQNCPSGCDETTKSCTPYKP